jgi:serine/threonine-protein kinase
MHFSRVNDQPPAMSTVTGTEERRAFFQKRIGTFGLCVFVLAGGTWALFAVIGALLPTAAQELDAHLWSPGDLLHVAGSLVAGLLYAATRARKWTAGQLHAFDVVGSLVVIAMLIAATALQVDANSGLLGVLLAFNATLLARAIVVPSTAGRTLFIGVVLGGSIVGVTVFDGLSSQTGLSPFFTASSWVVVSVTLSTVASRTIFGLRSAVHQALVMGQYTLEEKIGAGGMGEVWRASHAFLRRPTAVKLIAPSRTSAEAVRRFEREVQLTSQLTHPSTVAIYDYGRTLDGVFYYAMELVDGMDLERLVRRHGPLAPGRVAHVLIQICGALAEAHDRGLVHRDVKPANILLSPRRGEHEVAKIVDFGLVKRIDSAAQSPDATANDAVIGTPLYMSPEAIRTPESVNAASDLYSLGAVAWFLLTGRPPFEARSVVEVCSHHLHVEPLSPSTVPGCSIGAEFESLVMRCLAKKPADRPANMRALRRMLEACSAAEDWSPEQAQAWWSKLDRRGPDSSVRHGAEPDSAVHQREALGVDLEGHGAGQDVDDVRR